MFVRSKGPQTAMAGDVDTSIFYFLFYLGVHSDAIICSPMKPRAGMYRTV